MRDFEAPGRSLAVGKNGMVASSHSVATLTGIDILKAGGNAMDAAIAVCAVQCVVEAGSTGIGGDCFAMMSRQGSQEIVAYNGSGRTPAAAALAWYQQQGITTIERHSPHAVTIPGAVEAWARLNRDHGRLPLKELLAPAADLARNGYAIGPRVHSDLIHQRDLLMKDDTARAVFLKDGAAPAIGALQYQPKLADTLDLIGREGADAFYKGAPAAEMASYLNSLGGLHSREDFATAAGEYVQPIKTVFRGRTVYEIPPNGQGIIALMILNILSRFTPKPNPLDIENLHIEIEATRLAYHARDRFVADMAIADVPMDYLLSEALADELAGMIDPTHAMAALPVFDAIEHMDTVYITTVDKDRNAVSFINSLFHSYGSGLMTREFGIMLQNRGQGFSLTSGHPNTIAPRKRPMHTIIPAMVTENGRLSLSFGVMGGNYQAMGHAHLLARLFDHGMDLQTAIDQPRLFPLPGTRHVEAEARLRQSIGAALETRGFTVIPPRWAIGGAQAIQIDWENGTLLGGSDPRKDGCALGY